MEDISYKNSHRGTGLEPTRNQVTAFQNTNNSFDLPPSNQQNANNKQYLQKSSHHYRNISAEEDEARLLAHAQSNPTSADPNIYPRPMDRAPPRNPALASSAGDISTGGMYDPYARAKSPYQDQSGHLAPTEYGVATTTPERVSLETQDTSYHSPGSANSGGSARRVTPTTVPPDATPLGPPGRKSGEQAEWDMWGGLRERGEDESDLGGGHGVGDNRF